MLFALVVMQAALAEPALAQPSLDERQQSRLEACVAKIEAGPESAYEAAMAWANETPNTFAQRCAGLALIEMGRIEEGADRLASVAATSSNGPAAMRIGVLVQAGNAYLLARRPDKAKAALDRAIGLVAPEDPAKPELYIDRARAFAMMNNFRQAEEDLNRVLDARAEDPLALRLRAAARMRQGAFDLALRDAEAAVALDPKNVDALLVRGQAIEAKRTGVAPE